MSILEAGMLLCFGASWPFAVAKTYRTKEVRGQSRFFLTLVIIGYVFGILHKVFFNFDIVICLYIFNAILVSAELIMVYKYSKSSVVVE